MASTRPSNKRARESEMDAASKTLAVASESDSSEVSGQPSSRRKHRRTGTPDLHAIVQQTIENPQPQEDHPPSYATKGTNGDRLVVVMVGLPARGKSYIANRITRYLSFFHGATAQVFNVGQYRRKINGAMALHTFFDKNNEAALSIRNKCAEMALEDMKTFLQAGHLGRVAVFDATNTTRERRDWIQKEMMPYLQKSRQIIFVESICEDEDMVKKNIMKAKVTMPDYAGMKEGNVVDDFKRRIKHYADVYEPIDPKLDKDMSWIKIRDTGRNIQMNKIEGSLPARIVQFLMNLHCVQRPIYLSRHGRSLYNELGKIGGDSDLCAEGVQYAQELAQFCKLKVLPANHRTRLWTSSLRRTKMTAQFIPHDTTAEGWVKMRPRRWRSLDELYAGCFDGMTYAQIEMAAPMEFAARKKDKLGYRYPRGESYLDVITRLEPVVQELERQEDPVLIIAHQGIHRMLYSYFKGLDRHKAPFVSIPLNTVIKLTPGPYSCEEERIVLIPKSKKYAADPPSH